MTGWLTQQLTHTHGVLWQTNLWFEFNTENMTWKRCPLTASLRALTGIDNKAVFRHCSSSIGSSTPEISSSNVSMVAAMTPNVWGSGRFFFFFVFLLFFFYFHYRSSSHPTLQRTTATCWTEQEATLTLLLKNVVFRYALNMCQHKLFGNQFQPVKKI